MPIPGFTGEDSLYLSTQNYSNLDLWSIYPSSTRMLRQRIPRQPPHHPPRQPPHHPPRQPKRLPPVNPPHPCNSSDFDKCILNAWDNYKKCMGPYYESKKSSELGELEPLNPMKQCWRQFSDAEKKCTKDHGCTSGRCSDIGICCQSDTVPCTSTTGKQCKKITACGANETIDPSTCECVCYSGYTRCGSKCVDTQADDDNHCGSCDHYCTYKCQGGQCTCPTPLPDKCEVNSPDGSYTLCVDHQSDKNNCGMCGKKCPQGAECSEGECICGLSVDGPFLPDRCGDKCVHIFKDKNNCGDCGIVCPSGQYCDQGECTPVGVVHCYGTTCNDDGHCNKASCAATRPGGYSYGSFPCFYKHKPDYYGACSPSSSDWEKLHGE